jgi:hypothetical protein
MDQEKKMFETYIDKVVKNEETSTYIKFVQLVMINKLDQNHNE